MKRFRKIWKMFVLAMLILFVGYCVYQKIKEDASGPVISVEEKSIEVSIKDGDEKLLTGVTAFDKKDGDVTSSVIVEKISNFYGDNLRTVTYAAFDSDYRISKAEREISYTDYTSPRFELKGSLRFRAGENMNIDKIVSATDCLDGDLSNKIKIHMDTLINNRVTGFYHVVYEVINSAGDRVQLPIDVEIYEPYNNEVELNLDRYLIYDTGEEINYKDFLKSIRKGNLEYAFEGVNLTQPLDVEVETEPEEAAEDEVNNGAIPKSRVRVDAQVNREEPGVYPVYYYYTANHGNYVSEAKEVLYVVVE